MAHTRLSWELASRALSAALSEVSGELSLGALSQGTDTAAEEKQEKQQPAAGGISLQEDSVRSSFLRQSFAPQVRP